MTLSRAWSRSLVAALLLLSATLVVSAASALGGTPSRAALHAQHHGSFARPSLRRAKRVPPSKSAAATHPLYWGAWIGSQLTGAEAPWDYRAVTRFEQDAGRGVSLVSFASPFANCSTPACTAYPFPRAAFSLIRANGTIPFLSWASASLPVSPVEPAYRLRSVIDGQFDSYIVNWATAAREWGHPFFLRFDWEMNAVDFPWSARANGNTPAEYVLAWRHVHNLFAEAGASNATWVWCPNTDPGQPPGTLAGLYPGNAYVDWTCLDGYNTDGPWRSFSSVFQSYYKALTERVAPSKPMLIGETASTEVGGSKAAWIAGMFSAISHFPNIHGLIWFDRNTGGDWPVETSTAAQQAFREGVTSGPFVANQFTNLNTSPIPAP
jgi:mannan endo-1,4-beta-mannosidase